MWNSNLKKLKEENYKQIPYRSLLLMKQKQNELVFSDFNSGWLHGDLFLDIKLNSERLQKHNLAYICNEKLKSDHIFINIKGKWSDEWVWEKLDSLRR